MLYINKYCVQHTQKTYSHPSLAGMCCLAQEPRRKVTLIYISSSVILGCPKAVNTPHFIYKMLGKFQVSILLPAAFATGPLTAPRHRADIEGRSENTRDVSSLPLLPSISSDSLEKQPQTCAEVPCPRMRQGNSPPTCTSAKMALSSPSGLHYVWEAATWKIHLCLFWVTNLAGLIWGMWSNS